MSRSPPASRMASAKGISGPRWPAEPVVVMSTRIRLLDGRGAYLFRPGARYAGGVELGLQRREQAWLRAHRARQRAPLAAERRQVSGRLARVPLDRVQAVRAVGDVRRPEALAGGDQVVDALVHERAQRELERAAREVDVGVAAGRGVQI